MQVNVVSAAGKIPDPDEELVKRIDELPRGTKLNTVAKKIIEYREEKAGEPYHYPEEFEEEEIYRLTV